MDSANLKLYRDFIAYKRQRGVASYIGIISYPNGLDIQT